MALRSWGKGNAPVNEPDIYPVHRLDRMKVYQTFVATVMLFNDVLDADMLNASLSKLLKIGDWRKLGGRLKRGVSIHMKCIYTRQMSRQRC